jgi:putative membrane-bound dehydrogenase-like protein
LVALPAIRSLSGQEPKPGEKADAGFVPVGAAKVDITPSHPIRLSGYGNRAIEAADFETRIWARALAIGDQKPAVIITVENCGAATPVVERVAEQLARDPGIPRERISVCSSHSHTAPQINGFAPFIFATPLSPEEQKHIDDYTSTLADKLVEAARKAVAARRPAKLSWSVGKAAVAGNRRVLKDGMWTGFGTQADGPVDHSLPILAAHDKDGKLVAVLANYACHCTTLGPDFNRVSGDWAGYAQDYLETDHADAVALISIGCGADANPNPRGELEMAKTHGRTIADEVNRLLKAERKPVSTEVACKLDRVDLPLADLPSKEHWQEQVKTGRPQQAAHAKSFLERIEKGEKIPSTVPYTISTWTFGDDLVMVFLAGEVVVDYAIRLKSELDDARLWVTAYANDVPCYIPSKRVLREGGYEADFSMVYYGKPTRFAPGVEDVISDTVQRLTPPRFYSQERQAAFPPPKSPEESLQAITVRPGMRVELVAAEPLVVDPVAFDWGPDGRLWVVEMRDYPDGLDGRGQPGGRVKVLEDKDGDGRYDTAMLFLDDLPFPTGVKVWRDGVLVTAAPDIFYAADTDGDGRADKRKTLYRGFGEGNQQHRVNGLRWGLDNWLHVGNGDSGGEIKSLITGEVVNVSRRDLRIRPDEGTLEATSGNTQFGRERDDWGNWFGGNNSNPVWHYVLDEHYLNRNPHFAPPDAKHHMPVTPGAAPVFPTSRTLTRFNDVEKANRFTSACSPTIYRDTLLGEEFYGNVFVCEPVHNLVSRQIVSPDGVTLASRRADDEQDREFFASSDNWCRPSMVRTGPDGALWIADMYRFVIEHPKWIPEDWQQKLDVRAGDTRGRIYRVYPEGQPPRPMPRLDQLSSEQLVSQGLASENGIVRDLAQQMLVWKQDTAVIPALRMLVITGKTPQTRLQALCTLDGLGSYNHGFLGMATVDDHPAVRRNALRLCGPRVNDGLVLGPSVLARLNDDDPQLRLELAYVLGEWNDPQAAKALAELAAENHGDPYLMAAVMSSLNERNVRDVLAAALSGDRSEVSAALVEQLLAQAAAFGGEDALAGALPAIVDPQRDRYSVWQMGAAAAALDALARSGRGQQAKLLEQFAPLIEHARPMASNSEASEEERTTAMRLLGRDDATAATDAARLAALLGPQHPPKVQAAAVDALARMRRPETPQLLLTGWRSHTPPLRGQILDVLLARSEWNGKLLDALDDGTIAAAHIDVSRAQRLLGLRDAALRRRAEKLLAAASNSDRQRVVAQYQPALALTADTSRGKEVFTKRCSQCHKLEGVGHEVGPDLTALSDKSPQSLLVAMFDPNKAVEDKFLDYTIVTDDGRLLRGMLARESGGAITLAAPEGKQIVVLRTEIDEMFSNGQSMMPEGLEKDVSSQDTADVIAYVRGFGPAPREFEGNQPAVVTASDGGVLRLLAANCRIYGPRLVFERKHQNLGWWIKPEDRAVWSLVIPQAGEYEVALEYACADEAAGSRVQLRVAGETLNGAVSGTGAWDDYRAWRLGALTLPAGAAELEVRSDGRIDNALFDLRGVTLTPK